MQTPDLSMTAKQFAVWWLREGKPFQPPAAPTIQVGKFAGVTLYREGPFQVQLFIAQPGAFAPAHTHPNVDSVEIFVQGSGAIEVLGRKQSGRFVTVKPGDAHTAVAHEHGGSFLSVQKWLNGVQPTSVERDWDGAPIDDAHAKELATC
jgi:quercetin dioxygenase-like cupin family protein